MTTTTVTLPEIEGGSITGIITSKDATSLIKHLADNLSGSDAIEFRLEIRPNYDAITKLFASHVVSLRVGSMSSASADLLAEDAAIYVNDNTSGA